MNKYIGENRLTYLWGKIKAFVSNAISGKVDKVSSSTDNAVVRFDGASGNIQNSGVTINDNNQLTAAKFITSGGTSSQFVKGDGSLDSNTYAGAQTSGGAANKAVSIPFGQVDSTSTSTAFTATVDGITELRDGVCVYLRNGVVTSAANCTLNVNGLGAKPMYNTMAATTAISTQWNVSYTMLFIYNSTRVSGGCWDMFYGYYSDTNSVGYQLRTNSYTLPVSDTNRFYKIFFTSADNTKWVPASADTTNNTTSAKPVNQRPINPFGPIVYVNSSTNFTAGTNVTVNVIYQQIPLALGYSFNRTGAALTLTTSKPVFIKCAPQDDGSAIIDADVPYVQDLPTTEDGKIYIFLGVATSATTVELQMVHPVYYYKNGTINLWTGTGIQTDVFKSTESNVIDVGDYDLMKINEVKGKSLVMNQIVESFSDSWIEKNCTKTLTDGVFKIVPSAASNVGIRGISYIQVYSSHKYYCSCHIKANSSIIRKLYFSYYHASFGSPLNIEISSNWNKIALVGNAATDRSNGNAYLTFYNCETTDEIYVKNYIVIDLTQMFGAGNEPTTVEEVEAILGNDYYEYNTGEVVGNNVEKLDVTGFNIWDEEWEVGNINANGTNSAASDRIRSKNYIPVLPNTTYFFKLPISANLRVVEFDSSKTVIGLIHDTAVSSKTLALSVNAAYIRFVFGNSITPITTYNHDICINKSNTSKNGTYESYKHSEFPLNLTELTGKVNGEGTSVTIFPDGLHGVGTAYDSLIVDDDGYARRAVKRMGSVDLGSLTGWTWTNDSCQNTTYNAFKRAKSNSYPTNAVTSKYSTIAAINLGTSEGFAIWATAQRLGVKDANITESDIVSGVISKLNGVMCYYELATPIEYVLDTPVQCVAKVYPNGTVKQVPVMPDSTPMVMDVTYLRDNALYATKEYVNDVVGDIETLLASI